MDVAEQETMRPAQGYNSDKGLQTLISALPPPPKNEHDLSTFLDPLSLLMAVSRVLLSLIVRSQYLRLRRVVSGPWLGD